MLIALVELPCGFFCYHSFYEYHQKMFLDKLVADLLCKTLSLRDNQKADICFELHQFMMPINYVVYSCNQAVSCECANDD